MCEECEGLNQKMINEATTIKYNDYEKIGKSVAVNAK